MGNDKTQIQISVKTREELKRLGVKGQSYDSLVKQLIRFKEEHST